MSASDKALLPLAAQAEDDSLRDTPDETWRLLLVEDDPVVRFSLQLFLSKDFHVDTASDVASAIALLQQSAFPVVITDFLLPDGTGLDVIKYMHEHSPDTAIILITGSVESPEVAQVRQAAQNCEVLSKTTPPTELIGRVKDAFLKTRPRER